MILQKEVTQLSEQLGIAKSTVDKDWVLGHVVAAIYAEPELSETLIFKGGTCLKKCWFENYRFSEDLDFTSRSEQFTLTEQHLTFIQTYVQEQAGIATFLVSIRPLIFKDKLTGYEAILKFWGADHPRNQPPPPPERWQTKIKIEIILFEKLIFATVNRPLLHSYSDSLTIKKVPCYMIEEVLSEKIRALIQRSYTAPRDYYDIWFLSNNISELNWEIIVKAFHKKMAYKELVFIGVEQLLNSESDKALKAAWQNSLAHQIQSNQLPKYEQVKEALTLLFAKIF